jgi:hypothetical protein
VGGDADLNIGEDESDDKEIEAMCGVEIFFRKILKSVSHI